MVQLIVHSSSCHSRSIFRFSVTWGSLISTGLRTSSLLLYHPRFYPSLYMRFDREFRETCCGVANLCGLYQNQRPPNTCTGYNPPVWCKSFCIPQPYAGGRVHSHWEPGYEARRREFAIVVPLEIIIMCVCNMVYMAYRILLGKCPKCSPGPVHYVQRCFLLVCLLFVYLFFLCSMGLYNHQNLCGWSS